MADACIFCDIVAKKAPADVVHEDDRVLVIKNVQPQAPVHLLVIPKEHHPNLDSLSDRDLLADMVATAKQVGDEQSGEKGYRLNINSAKQADIGHIHLHVLGGLDKETAL
ncbi:MAG TPA: HIT domain-containing protein [Patescibacteria group bacterium]|jgi:histidine triad (HIT) family protein